MDGQLCFIYTPVRNLKSALKFYRDQLGLIESWREGELTAGLKLPGTDVELMIDQIVDDSPSNPGPMFLVSSVDEFYATEKDKLNFAFEPIDIPDGRLVGVTDDSGNAVYFIDQSKAL